MLNVFLFFLLFMFVIAALVRDRFAVTVLYLFAGAYFAGRWWVLRGMRNIQYHREFERHAFPDEVIKVQLVLKNTGWLPLVWLRVHDSLPIEISRSSSFKQIISLGPHQNKEFEYELTPGKRGYYQVGPMLISSGDLLGLTDVSRREGEPENMIVYPRVISLDKISIPSRTPLGTLRYAIPTYEDPTRQIGKRDYSSGDSYRRVDWKATAVVGRLQVKLFEPSVDLQTAIFLNLNADEYHYRYRYDATELAITTAASVASWVVRRKQQVGFWTNGIDQLSLDGKARPILPHKGHGHLMRILEILARIKIGDVDPYSHFLNRNTVQLGWGTTLILISGSADQGLFDQMIRSRRMGLEVVLVICGAVSDFRAIHQRARHFGIKAYHFEREKDLDIWRRPV